jgi:ABC-type dipeptide/oligopeptide/nickel transport system permease component
MLRYAARRLVIAVPVVWGVATIVFILMHLLPGDPAATMLAQSGGQASEIARLRESLGLDQPLISQYWRFLSRAVTGDLGESIWLRRPVSSVLAQGFPSTAELALAAAVLAAALGIPLGVLAALKAGSVGDRAIMAGSLLGLSMPVFWSGLLGIYLFAGTLHWLPATGAGSADRLVLPALILGLGAAGSIARLARSGMLDALRQDHVTVARAKGLRERTVVLRHALRNSLIPVVTMLGMQFSSLLGGAVVVETVFSRPGLGRTLVDAIVWKDFPLVQGGVIWVATVWVVVNLLVDLSYALLDPRVRVVRGAG